jgi:hypothetical protein
MAAKQKQPSMLTRQRQLRRQQQATKAASRNQLPSSGNTTASSTRAQAQRVGTAVRQRANQDMTVIRALADNMKRNQARSDRQIKPDPSPKTRYVGPGGANPKAKQLPPGTKGGQMQAKGGPIVKAGSSQVTQGSQSTQTRSVRGEVVSNPTRSSASKPNRGAIEKAGPTIDVKANSEKLPAGRQGGAMSQSGSGGGGALANRPGSRPSAPSRTNAARGGGRAAVIAALAEPFVADVGQKLGNELGNRILKPIGRRLDDMMPGVNSRDEADRKRRSQPLPAMTPAQRAKAVRLKQAEPSDVGRTASGSSSLRTRQAETQSGGRPRSASQQSSTSVPSAPRAPKAPPAPRAPQSAPKAPDSPSMSGVGPTKDGSLYSDKLKISQIEAGKEPDMERRRAFLDAKDSMSGVKAVKELLAKRKKRMGEG